MSLECRGGRIVVLVARRSDQQQPGTCSRGEKNGASLLLPSACINQWSPHWIKQQGDS